MNDMNSANAYLRTKVMTASKEELRLMLLVGAIRFANQAKLGLEQSDHEAAYLGFTQCRDIVLELLNTINDQPAPEIAKPMKELYTFLYSQLVKASFERDKTTLDEVIGLLNYDRETWVLTMDQVAAERENGIEPSMELKNSVQPAHQPISFQA